MGVPAGLDVASKTARPDPRALQAIRGYTGKGGRVRRVVQDLEGGWKWLDVARSDDRSKEGLYETTIANKATLTSV